MTGPDRETLRHLVREAIAEALAELRPGPAPASASDLRVVTEKTIAALPEGSTLRLSPEAAVTPLARDRARARRITIERTR